MSTFTCHLLFASLSFLISDGAAGEEIPQEMSHMVVTATRSAENIETISGTVRVIESKEIAAQMQPGRSLGDALGLLIPSMGTSTQVRTNYTQSMRGRDVLVLIDGIPQNDNRKISRELDTIAPENILRVEVLSGATAVHGSGAMGGIVNIITRKNGGEAFEASTTLSLGAPTEAMSSQGSNFRLAQSLSARKGAWDIFLGASFERRQGDFDAHGNRIAPEPAQTSLGDSDFTDIQLKTGWQVNSDSRFTLFVQSYEDAQNSEYAPNYGGPGLPIFAGQPVDPVAVEGLQLSTQPFTKRKAAYLTYQDADFLGQLLDARLYWRERSFRFFPFPQPLQGINPYGIVINQSTSDATVYGLRLQLESQLSDRAQLTWGVDHQVDKGSQHSITFDPATFIASGGLVHEEEGSLFQYGPDVDTTQTGPFAQLRYQPNDRWTLRAGVRAEFVEADIATSTSIIEALVFRNGLIPYTTPLAGDQLNYETLAVNAGAVYALKYGEVFGSYAQGYELPDTARLLRNALSPDSLLVVSGVFPGGTLVSESELEAIKTDHYELAWRMRRNALKLQLSLFSNRSDKTVAFNPDYTVSILPQNKRVNGVEATIEGKSHTGFGWGATYAYTHGERKDPESGWLNLSAAEVSPTKWTGHLSWDPATFWDVKLQGLHLQDDDRAHKDVSREAAIEGYTTLDLIGNMRLGKAQLSATVHNLANEEYQSVYSQWATATYGPVANLPALGRSLALTCRLVY